MRDVGETDEWGIHEYSPTEQEAEFIRQAKGIRLAAQPSGRGAGQPVLAADSVRFGKWLAANSPDTEMSMEQAPTLALHSRDFWMPFVVLASDVVLQVYLGLVVSYVYDCLKGALQHDRHVVHVSTVFRDVKAGTFKRFEYSGPVEGLEKCVEEIDLDSALKE